jgi:hypothetical protein
MSSKQLDSILSNIPSATVAKAQAQKHNIVEEAQQPTLTKIKEDYERIVAVVPKELKDEIREHLKNNKSATEKTVILKGLKLLGFNIKNEWLLDKRTTR